MHYKAGSKGTDVTHNYNMSVEKQLLVSAIHSLHM